MTQDRTTRRDTAVDDVSQRLDHRMQPLVADLIEGRVTNDTFERRLANLGTPLVEVDSTSPEHRLVTFVWKLGNDAHHVVLLAGGFPDPIDHVLAPIADTRFCYATYRIRHDALMRYAFVEDLPAKRWWTTSTNNADELNTFLIRHGTDADPLNPRSVETPGLARQGINSLLELDGALDDRWLMDPAARGDVTTHRYESAVLGNARDVQFYRPPDGRAPERVLIVFDGEWYRSIVPTRTILDNLHDAHAIPPTAAVFIDNVDRGQELPCNDRFSNALASEFAPWLHTLADLPVEPRAWFVVGSSFGGLAAIWAAFRYPQVFGNVISAAAALSWDWQSASPRAYQAMRAEGHTFDVVHRAFDAAPTLPVRFWLEVGLLDAFEINVEPNRRFAKSLRRRGYDVEYREYPGGHDFVLWRKTLPLSLIEMLR